MKPLLYLFPCICLAACPTLQALEVDFQKDIQPILEKRCWKCHGEDKQESGLRLDLRAAMLRGGDLGIPALVPGRPEKSALIEAVKHLDPELKMPPKRRKLPEEEIQLLSRWIKAGAVWPGQMKTVARKKSTHWSFQPVKRPGLPAPPAEQAPAGSPIDAFLQSRLASAGLEYSKPADALALIKRASIVLTGLTPTPEESAAFTDSFSREPEKAYLELVDRLLASPHFGERWAQHWLDVIRWAETNGSESNMYRKNAWIYRDYVIRAFNEDLPYDQFIFEQLAGDTSGQGDATGYLVSGPHVPAATVGQEPSAQRQARADRIDEILQTVGASALGMTIGCARCHNHKFDPISIRDYYSMSAVFQDIEFGSRFPELSADHPRRIRGGKLYKEIADLHEKLRRMGPWEENWTGYRELHFSPVKTRTLRITFQWNYARIDELEIFGTEERNRNLALAANGARAHSPKEMAVVRSELHKINDGEYGTQAWAGRAPKGSKQKPWVQFTFPSPQKINRIRLSTNREDYLSTDYLLGINKFNFGPYRVEALNPDGKWRQVAATGQLARLDKKHPSRKDLLGKLEKLIARVSEEGPRPSFIARFVKPSQTFVLYRGSPESPRDEVVASGLEELDGDLDLEPNSTGKERRKAFALWLTSAKHPLTARVAVNRLWHHVFGQGIVTTTGDFGAAGAPPTHPALLDWLAAELTRSAPGTKRWSLKRLIRLMVTSRAFRQSSLPREAGLAADAASTLLWRYPPRRVEAEVIRDSILQAAGSLNRAIGGRSFRIHNVKKRYAQWKVTDNHSAETWRRMIYQERMRRVDDRMFTAFDFPDCGQVRAKRPISTTPLQALNLLNSVFVNEQARRIAERASKDATGDLEMAISRCFQLLLNREPDKNERQACLSLAKNNSLALVCRALLNTNEFAFIP